MPPKASAKQKLKALFRPALTPSAATSRAAAPDPQLTGPAVDTSAANQWSSPAIPIPASRDAQQHLSPPASVLSSTPGIGRTPPSVGPSSALNPDRLPSAYTVPAPAVSSVLLSTLPPADSGFPRKELGWKVFMQGLGVLKEVSVIFPPLQAAAAGLFRVLEQVGEITDARDDLAEMAQRISALGSLLQRYEGRIDDPDIRDRLEGMAMAINHQTNRIEQKLAPGIRNIITNSPDARYIMECTRAVSFLINIFEMDTALHTEGTVTELNTLA
ncbi:hypothetical protein DFH09DRAFT_1360445, partial [Mycena vulgaris]